MAFGLGEGFAISGDRGRFAIAADIEDGRAMRRAGLNQRLNRRIGIPIVLGLWAPLMLAATVAEAEQVVMPYACAAYGRDINLTPSQQRSYEIIGRHEQDLVTACAPNDPNRCKTWRIHRFDVSCGGARVPWVDVVDAANAQNNGPARLRGGRLYVRMDPWWARRSVPAWADRPKLREFDDGDSRPDNFRYQPSARAPSVEMPPGFAPIVGLSARFTGTVPEPGPGPGVSDGAPAGGADRYAYDDRGTQQSQPGTWIPKEGDTGAASSQLPPIQISPPVPKSVPAPKPAVAEKSDPTPASTGKTSTRDPGHTFAPKPAESKPAETVAAVAPAGDAKPADSADPAKATAAPVPAPPASTPEATAAVAPTAGSPSTAPVAEPTINSIAPTILNRPGAESTAITAASSSSGDKAGTDIAASNSALPVSIETGTNPTLGFAGASRGWTIAMGIAALMLLATAMAFFVRRQNDARLNPQTAARDLSSVSLDPAQSRSLVRTAHVEPELSTAPSPAKAEPLQITEVREFPPELPQFVSGPVIEPDWLPTTREEALHVLGAGPDASDAVLKKIVDGLRMSWHPDHAKSPEDHRMRSERMTQINVAWDILAGRQPANASL